MSNFTKDSPPPCPHFQICGGCDLQHLSADEYYFFKQNILSKIVSSLGVDSSIIRPITPIGENSRRRIELKISVNKLDIKIGFFDKKSHNIFDLDVCLVSDDRLIKIIPRLKDFLQGIKKPSSIKAVSLTIVNDEIDAIIAINKPLNASDKQDITDFAKNNKFSRLSEKYDDSYRVIYGDAKISFGEYQVKLPAGAFLQATESGQIAITNLVIKYLQNCKKVADLYSGCGTYSFPLIKSVKYVCAFEGSAEMVNAMHNAITNYELEDRMSVSVRDLYKNPVDSKTLSRFDAVVINPPRNGALPQVKKIAESAINNVVIVSCNPNTFKRDAKYLLDNNYKMIEASAIDQFYWNKHLEIVALFQLKQHLPVH